MTKTQVLFISIDGLTDPLGQSQILPYLFKLSKDYSVTVLTAEKAHNLREKRTLIKELVNQAMINWEYIDYSQKVPIVSSYLNYRRLKIKAKALTNKNRFTIVHCRSLMPAMIGHSLKRNFQSKLIFDIRGFWADERIEGKIWNKKNPIHAVLYKFFKRQELNIFKDADYIISLTEKAKKYILENFETKGKVEVIPCAVDLDHFNPEAVSISHRNKLQEKINLLQGNYILGYIGSLGTRYRFRDMLRFFKELLTIKKEAIFLIVSKHNKKEIISYVEEMRIPLEKIRIVSSTFEEIPYYITMMTASIFFIEVGFTGKAVSPTKQAEIWAMNKPIVANRGIGDTDKFMQKGGGIFIKSYAKEHLRIAAETLLKSDNSHAPRRIVEEHFSLSKAAGKYASVYKTLVDESA